MKIVSWNINSLKARMQHVKRYLTEAEPDVLMVQELKGEDFPAAVFEAMGYHTACVPQKAYNGVAIFSKQPIQVLRTALPGSDDDTQARYLEVEISGLRMMNIYLPNGNPVGTEKYTYKLGWMERLYGHLKSIRNEAVPFLIGGDFNVIPEDRDCHDPKAWAEDALFRQETRRAYRKVLHLGLTDALRALNNRPEEYTFWDYQAGAWQKNWGIRIDHFLLSPEIADRLKACAIDRAPRGWDKASDHTPIAIDIDWAQPFPLNAEAA